MGGTHPAAKQVKPTSARSGSVFEPVLGVIREAVRAKDLTIPTLTLYVQEDIGVGNFLEKELNPIDSWSGQITGVYVPPSVKPGATVNVILFLHGDKVRVWDQHGTIRDYWNLPKVPLRQGLKTSGKPFILVAPTLGKKASKEFGNLGANIDDHLDHVLAKLHQLGAPEFPLSQPPDIGQLIIAGHSGAFGPIKSILASMKKYKSKIKEIWGFDMMYGDTASHLATVTVPVYTYFNDTATNSRALAAMRKPNIFVMESVDFYTAKGKPSGIIHHDLLMQRFWLDRCQRIGTDGKDPEDKRRMVRG